MSDSLARQLFDGLRSAAVVLAAALVIAAQAQPVGERMEKDGKPCVREICLGDGMAELKKIKWERSRTLDYTYESSGFPVAKQKVYDGTVESMQKNLKAPPQVLRAVAPWLGTLAGGFFDSDSLPLLEKIEASCSGVQAHGRFQMPGGMPTIVYIRMSPMSASDFRQAWKVFKIERFFPKNLTREQQDGLDTQIRATYGPWLNGGPNLESRKTVVTATLGSSVFPPSFQMSTEAYEWEKELLLKHPLCGVKGNLRIN